MSRKEGALLLVIPMMLQGALVQVKGHVLKFRQRPTREGVCSLGAERESTTRAVALTPCALVRMYMRVCKCMYVCIYIYTHAMYICVDCMYACMHIMYLCMRAAA